MNSIHSTQLSGHLNDDQFTECLLGAEPGSEAATHLPHCEACREELARFSASVGTFNAAAMAWSKSQPSVSLEGSMRGRGYRVSWTHRPFATVTSWALAACLMLVAGVSIMQHRGHHDGPANMASMIPPQEDSEAQIAEDNKLLMDVDLALQDRSRAPELEYGLQPRTNVQSGQRGEARTQ
jgi:hypothetical protein